MVLEEIETLRVSERGRVTLMRDAETGKRYVRKELQGQYPVYTQLQTLAHPYLPRIEKVALEEDRTVILEEYIEGVTLDRVSLSQGQLTRLLLELCGALEFLHGHGILHRDIKPSNLMLAADGHLRLIDFDAARRERPQAEQDTRLLGTRGYAPPEQYGFAQTDTRSDIYALGVTFRQLLGPLARKRRWRKLLRKCTALDPKDRYASAAQVKRAVYLGRIRRWILRPLLILAGLALAAYLGLWVFFYHTNADFRWILDNVHWFDRPYIFETVDMERIKAVQGEALQRAWGDIEAYADAAEEACPEKGVIYTGYVDEDERPLFGVFELSHDRTTGRFSYGHFLGLCAVGKEGQTEWLSIERCEAEAERYAPAILALYELDVFDTPIL